MKSFAKEREKRNKTLGFTCILLGVLLMFNVFSFYNSITSIKKEHADELKSLQELEWNMINSVLTENQDKASIQANYLKDNIKKDLTNSYKGNQTKLKYDIENLDTNNDFLKIINDNLSGVYLNVKSDNNDLFVVSTWQTSTIDLKGEIIYDKSINCSSNGEMRLLDSELAKHYNYNLGHDALNRILNESKEKPIFWEFLTNNNPNHIMLDSNNINDMKEVFLKEGIEGLKSYEILNPVYINDTDDLLGISKINNSGIINNDNRQIIIVQGFSLYDVLMKNHKIQLQSFDNDVTLENANFYNSIRNTQLINLFGDVLALVVFLSIMKIQNLSIEIDELVEEEEP